MTDDIEYDDPESLTEDLRDPEVPDADRTGFDDEAVSVEQDPAQRADADDREAASPEPDELSPGEHLGGDDWGSVEPNEPA